jgi:hypothetical protein
VTHILWTIFGFVRVWFGKYTFNENFKRRETREQREREREREIMNKCVHEENREKGEGGRKREIDGMRQESWIQRTSAA